MIWRPAVAGAVQPIDAVAGLYEVMHPTRPAADAHHVGALPAASMNHDYRIWMALLGGDHVLHIHLALGDGAVGHLLALRSYPEAALVGELQAERFAIWMRVGAGRRRRWWEGLLEP